MIKFKLTQYHHAALWMYPPVVHGRIGDLIKAHVWNEFNGIYDKRLGWGEIEFTSEEDLTLFLLKI